MTENSLIFNKPAEPILKKSPGQSFKIKLTQTKDLPKGRQNGEMEYGKISLLKISTSKKSYT
jgi:hypothetical protein